jgi:type III restriction enzyme
LKLKLKDFQEEAVQNLLARAGQAAGEVEAIGDPQALVLSAPTGSGKTAMATSLLERLVNGDDAYGPDPEATFLWLTDQPELNEQTKRKLEASSDYFAEPGRLVTIEAASFDEELLEPGRVYFLNTQKLGKKSSLIRPGDKRTHSMWATVSNTVAERPGSFWLVIDEAHRGMIETPAQRKEAQSITQKFIKGSPEDGLPEVPLVLGVSATPERFYKLLEGTTRTQRMVSVDPEVVRDSGLLKETITLYHTDEDQPSDLTLLGAATAKLAEYDKQWTSYAKAEETDDVRPALVVQVQDGTKRQLTRTDLEAVFESVKKGLGREPKPDEIAHSFQEGGQVALDGGYTIPYVAPSDIEERPDLRVVLFKMALTTGWDCPRAEVMMSFRPAKDETLIAQLVGRMVRAPLARQVSGSDLLNSVSLYLPYYDETSLTKVIDTLSQPDPDQGLPGTPVQRGNELVTLKRNPKMTAAFDAAQGLPVHKVQRVTKQSPIRRLMRLGRRLSWDDLDPGAPAKFEKALLDVLDRERKRLADDKDYKRRYDEAGRIDIRAVTVEVGKTELTQEQRAKLPVEPRNVDHAFDEAGRRLGGGLHTAYLKRRATGNGESLLTTKRELFALLQDPEVLNAIEDKATKLANEQLAKHKSATDQLPDEKRLEYRLLKLQGDKPVDEPWELPETIEGPKKGERYKGHLYVKGDGSYTCTLNAWEKEVIGEVLKDKSVVGWLRNDPRKPWSFSVAYYFEKEDRPMYPDFIVFRKTNGSVACDIIEPHSLSWADSAAKAKGLADFAFEHGEEFGRILLIAKTGGSDLKRLPLHQAEVCNEVRGVKDNERLKELVAAF